MDTTASPFTLGVASGDPLHDRVVIWTRLAPDPLNGGGMPPRDVPVSWQVAEDPGFRRVVRQGTATARPDLAHSVHVDVAGLRPQRWYHYRFCSGGAVSPAGRTRTSPAPGAATGGLTFAFASCQQYEHGYFTAYRHMAAEDLDLVVHLGDYIYENGAGTYAAASGNVRRHCGDEAATLADYRNRHAQYRTDPDLQAAHAACPWIVTWDDHEVDDNYAGATSRHDAGAPAFLARRANAYRAFWEHLPLRVPAPAGPDLRIYRRLRWGDLAEFNVLDTRQYRSDQPCDDAFPASCGERFHHAQTMTGAAQEAWLKDGLVASRARWNVLAQQVFMAQLDLGRGSGSEISGSGSEISGSGSEISGSGSEISGSGSEISGSGSEVSGSGSGFSVDGWDGYVDSRNRLLDFLAARRIANPVVLTGDWHANWVCELKADFDDPESRTVGTEFVGTSITSGGDGAPCAEYGEQALRRNPHVRYFNDQRGYVRCHLDHRRWRSDYRVVPFVSRPGAPVATAGSFEIRDGVPVARRV